MFEHIMHREHVIPIYVEGELTDQDLSALYLKFGAQKTRVFTKDTV